MKPRLIGIGFARSGYGFGRVFQSLYETFRDDWELHHLDLGRETIETDWVCVHRTRRPAAVFGYLEIGEILDAVSPDLIFYSDDPWMLPPYIEALQTRATHPALVAYLPVGASLAGFQEIALCADADRLITPTQFGRACLAEALASQPAVPAIEVIPHGIDSDTFFPLSPDPKLRMQIARRRLFADDGLDDAFIVFNGNRNQPRKRLDITIEGFARFAEDKPENVKLMLHTGTIDQGCNIVALANRYGVGDRILRPVTAKAHPVVENEILNLIYNAADVGLNTANYEGWGLVSFEHARTGAAQIVPGHGACAEIWGDCARQLKSTPIESANPMCLGEEVSVASLVEALNELYHDSGRRQELGERGARLVSHPEYQWPAVAESIGDVLRSAVRSADS